MNPWMFLKYLQTCVSKYFESDSGVTSKWESPENVIPVWVNPRRVYGHQLASSVEAEWQIYASDVIGSDNYGFSPVRHQAIIWPNADVLSVGHFILDINVFLFILNWRTKATKPQQSTLHDYNLIHKTDAISLRKILNTKHAFYSKIF